MVKNLSCVSCAAWNVFPINSLPSGTVQYIKVELYYLNCAVAILSIVGRWKDGPFTHPKNINHANSIQFLSACSTLYFVVHIISDSSLKVVGQNFTKVRWYDGKKIDCLELRIGSVDIWGNYLILVMVSSIQHHGLKSMPPENFMWQVRCPGLKCITSRLNCALQNLKSHYHYG